MELKRDRWAEYFRSLPAVGARQLATVELLSEEMAQARDHRPPLHRLRAIGYRPLEDEVVLAVGGLGAAGPALRFYIPAPEKIAVTEHQGSRDILIDDASGTRTLICLLVPQRARELARRPAPAARRPSRPRPALGHHRSSILWAVNRRGCGSSRRAAPR
jgi:hypothetical protein